MQAESLNAPAAPMVSTAAQTSVEPTRTEQTAANWLTVERGLYFVILAIAIFLRFFALTAQPLNSLEAHNAWPAWLAAQGVEAPNPPTPDSALYYSLHTLLFWITDGGDGMARSIPAMAGIGLVALSWWLRPWFGRTAALLIALLITIDPWLTAMSRLSDGAALSLLLGMLTLVALMQLRLPRLTAAARRWWLNVAAVGAGLLVTSGPTAWNFLVVLGLWWLLSAQRSNAEAELDEATEVALDASTPAPSAPPSQPLPYLLFLATLIFGATAWLSRPEGLGLISTGITGWLQQLTGGDGQSYPLSWAWIRLVVDEPHLLVFGLMGLVQLWQVKPAESEQTSGAQSERILRLFLSVWLLWGVILVLLPGRNPLSLPLLGLPLVLLAAQAGAAAWQRDRLGELWREIWLLVAVVTILLIAAAFWGWAAVAQVTLDLKLVRGALLFFLLAVMMIVLFALWSDWRAARRVAVRYVGCVLLLIAMSAHWQLNQRFALREPDGFFAQVTDPDVRTLAANIHELSAQRTGDATEITVLVQMKGQPDPVLGWYLRDLRNLSWVLAPAVQITTDQHSPVVITHAVEGEERGINGFYGSRYRLRSFWLPEALTVPAVVPVGAELGYVERLTTDWPLRLRPWLRWMLYRKVNETPPTEAVNLWVQGIE